MKTLGRTKKWEEVFYVTLGVTINAYMKVSEQCRIAASQSNQILEMIQRNITYKEKGLIVQSNGWTSLRIMCTGMGAVSQEVHRFA